MPDTAPLKKKFSQRVAGVAAGSDLESDVCVAPFAGVVSLVSYVADTALTGANTDSRTLSVKNKGQSGAGTTVIASKAFVSATNAAADDETAISLSSTAADLVVAAGDVLAFVSTHVGSTGLADPGGLVTIEITRS
jgi:hypothetical protein